MEINKPVSIVIIFVIALSILFLFALPKYQESLALELELEQKRAQYEGRVDYYVKLVGVVGEIEQQQDALQKIDAALPPDLALAPLVNYLQEKAVASGLVLKSVNFSNQVSGQEVVVENLQEEIKNTVLRIELQGSYSGLKKFLVFLEKSAKLFEVNSISFTSNSEILTRLRGSEKYDFTLEIQTYTY